MLTVLKRCLQPPVIAALLGLLFASFPAIRGVFVDIVDRDGTAPLQWFFDGLFETGRAAVPINMIILGCNMSAAYMLEKKSTGSSTNTNNNAAAVAKTKEDDDGNNNNQLQFSARTSLLVVFGKMIVMPIVGMISTFLLEQIYVVPHELTGGLYLVLLIVFLCPTANNVMVMVELSSGGSSGRGGGSSSSSKESMAKIIAYQYAVTPILLSLTVSGAVLMASHMASKAEAATVL